MDTALRTQAILEKHMLIFVPAAELAAWSGGLAWKGVVGVEPSDDGLGFRLHHPGTAPAPLTRLPGNCAALLALEPEHLAMLVDFRGTLTKLGARHLPEPALVKTLDPIALIGQIAASMQRLVTAIAEHAATLSGEVVRLRRANEDLQHRFAGLEAFVARRGLQPCDLAFESEPDQAGGDVLDGLQFTGIAQILPTASTGIVAFGLHVWSGGTGDAPVRITLETLEDGLTVGQWSLPSGALEAGWHAFSLPRTLSGPRRTLQVTISFDNSLGRPVFSAGALQPLPRYQMTETPGGDILAPRNLAFRVWSGVPGVSSPELDGAWPAETAAAKQFGPRERSLRRDELSRVVLGNRHEMPDDFEPVTLHQAPLGVFCHPPREGRTVAVLPGVLPPTAMRVSARVRIASERAKDIAFRLAVGRAGAEGAPSQEIAHSDWVTVQAGEEKSLALFLPPGSEPTPDLFLMTRMAEEGNNDFGWAIFNDLSLLLDTSD
jgi:Family of unknown function (DUF6212)